MSAEQGTRTDGTSVPAPQQRVSGTALRRITVPIAADAHVGQLDRFGRPYLEHPLRVAERAAALAPAAGVDPELAYAAGLLHDVVEDSDWTPHDLAVAGLPDPVVLAVARLTHEPHVPSSQHVRAICCDPLAVVVKLADTLDNAGPVRLAALPHGVAAWLRISYAEQGRLLQDAYRELVEGGRR